jgi:protein-disulfide isomerase
MDKRFVIILVGVILVFVGIFLFSQNDSGTVGAVSNNSKGNLSSSVEVIEYADFQCPACGQFFPIISAVQEKYKDTVKFTFRHFPIDTIHPNARSASRAAEAAGLQGKFFEMHDLLFENQNTWSTVSDPIPTYNDYATQLKLDMAKFEADFASETTNATINADRSEGAQKGVEGTPTFFLNGQKLNNEDINSIETFSQKIDEALQANQ